MIPSVLHKRVLRLAAIALVATSAFSQSSPRYDPATETTVKGTVGEVKLVPPTGGKPIAYLVAKTGPDKDKDTVLIFLCPKSFLDDMGASFKAADAVEVTGSKVKHDSTDMILAREVVKGDDVLTLRFKDGKPAW